MKTFRQYVEMMDTMDQDVDNEIAKNPKLLMGTNADPKQQQIAATASANKKTNPQVSMDAAYKAAQMVANKKPKPGMGQPQMGVQRQRK
jgi:hypothetical protein